MHCQTNINCFSCTILYCFVLLQLDSSALGSLLAWPPYSLRNAMFIMLLVIRVRWDEGVSEVGFEDSFKKNLMTLSAATSVPNKCVIMSRLPSAMISWSVNRAKHKGKRHSSGYNMGECVTISLGTELQSVLHDYCFTSLICPGYDDICMCSITWSQMVVKFVEWISEKQGNTWILP